MTDHKPSGVKYIQNEILEKYQQMDPHLAYFSLPQYAPQVIYKSCKYKQTSFPYLIPF